MLQGNKRKIFFLCSSINYYFRSNNLLLLFSLFCIGIICFISDNSTLTLLLPNIIKTITLMYLSSNFLVVSKVDLLSVAKSECSGLPLLFFPI